MKSIFLIFISSFFLFSNAQNKPSYLIYDQNGKKASYKDIINSSQKSDVLLFGEYHDNSVAHWLELEITKDLFGKTLLVLGAEMLEADNQKQVNQYLKGEINQKKLDSTARLWPNYKTDYKPLVDFAKENKIDFIFTSDFSQFNKVKTLNKVNLEKISYPTWILPFNINHWMDRTKVYQLYKIK